MALQNSYSDLHGHVDASAYHMITLLNIQPGLKVASWVVSIYKDEAARTAEKQPMRKIKYSLHGDDYDTYFAADVLDVVDQNPQERAYTYLKTLDEYDGASDV